MISTQLDNVFRSVRVAASNAGTGFERLRLDARARSSFPRLTIYPNKRMRYATRKDQAKLFAMEEAELHQQLLIEEEIFERQMQLREQREEQPTEQAQQQDNGLPAQEAERRDAPVQSNAQSSSEPAEHRAPAETANNSNHAPAETPIRLAPALKTSDKVVAIERKLSLIRQRLAASPKNNEAGIAVLRAAVAC